MPDDSSPDRVSQADEPPSSISPASASAPSSIPQSSPATSSATSSAAEIEAVAVQQMLAINGRRVIVIGTALFFIAFIALLPFWNWLGEHGHRVWLWTSLAGWVLGAAATPLVRKHRSEGRLG